MDSLQRVQKVAKVLHVLSIIAFVCSIVGLCLSVISSIAVIIWANDPEVINYFAQMDITYSFNNVLCSCICGVVQSAAGIAVYYYVKRFYKNELELGTPFNKDISKELKKLGIFRIVLSIVMACVLAIIVACFNSKIDFSNISGIFVGIVYLIVACILNYGAELKVK